MAQAGAKADAKQSGSRGQSKSEADGQAKAKQSGSRGPSKSEAEAQANAKRNASEQEQEQEREKPSPDGEGKKRRPRFVPPTVEEVREYARGKGWDVDAEHFVAYYGSQGWRKGNGMPLTNWKLAVSNWHKNDGRFGRGKGGRESFEAIDWSAYELDDVEVIA